MCQIVERWVNFAPAVVREPESEGTSSEDVCIFKTVYGIDDIAVSYSSECP